MLFQGATDHPAPGLVLLGGDKTRLNLHKNCKFNENMTWFFQTYCSVNQEVLLVVDFFSSSIVYYWNNFTCWLLAGKSWERAPLRIGDLSGLQANLWTCFGELALSARVSLGIQWFLIIFKNISHESCHNVRSLGSKHFQAAKASPKTYITNIILPITFTSTTGSAGLYRPLTSTHAQEHTRGNRKANTCISRAFLGVLRKLQFLVFTSDLKTQRPCQRKQTNEIKQTMHCAY